MDTIQELRTTLSTPPPLLNENSDYENMVIIGGGVKLIAFLGKIAALEEFNFPLNRVKRFAGTSAGSISAMVMALRLSTKEIQDLFFEIDFTDFLDKADNTVPPNQLLAITNTNNSFFQGIMATTTFLRGLPQLTKEYGLYSGEYLRKWIEAIIVSKTKIPYCTFQEFHELQQIHPELADLYVVGVNTNKGIAHTFSFETTPNVIISDAIRISCGIPFIYQPHHVYLKVQGKRVAESNDLWVDGGVLENYPLDLFDQGRYVEGADISSDQTIANPKTLGFFFAHGSEKAYLENRALPDTVLPESKPIKDVKAYYLSLAGIFIDSGQFNEHVREHENQRTIYIDPGKIKAVDFDLSPEDKKSLITAGWMAVCKAYGRMVPVPDELLEVPEAKAHEHPAAWSSCILS